MFVSRLEKLFLTWWTILSIAIGAAGGVGVLFFLFVLRLPSTDRLVDVSGCMVAAGLAGLATFGVVNLLTETRR